MEFGKVVGNVWATRKVEELRGSKFLVVCPILPNGLVVENSSYIAVDEIGAGVGDMVMVTKGSSAANMISDSKLPIDALIIGIIDSVDVERSM